MADNKFNARLDIVPVNPGVYLMKDTAGSVIYVGKAINLRNRLRSYFNANPKGNSKVLAMISHIADFSFIVCDTEIEALILECNLIKQHRPHYNILLRDDKEYPYIRVTLNEDYPRVLKAFRIESDIKSGAKYYGPYMASNLKSALEALRSIFPIKTCNKLFPRDIGKERPCLNYHIGKCIAPCKGDVSKDEYRLMIQDICNFLSGRYDVLIKQLKSYMKNTAETLDFEKAAIYRDRLNSLMQLMQKQTVSDTNLKDVDSIGFAANGSEVCIQKLQIRQGRMIGNASFFASEADTEHTEILKTILLQHYLELGDIPPKIYLPFEISEKEIFEEALSLIAKRKVAVSSPVRSYGKELNMLSDKNATQSLRRHSLLTGKSDEVFQNATSKLSQILFDDDRYIRRIEAFDVSNYGSDDISASMVVFVDGKPDKSQYRLFKIKDLEIQDDYTAMTQAISRRLGHIEDDSFGGMPPQLILVDGGKGHLGAALNAIDESSRKVKQKNDLEATNGTIALDGNRLNEKMKIAVLGMQKDKRHRTSALVFEDGSLLNLTNEDNSDILQREEQRALLRLISAIQDEAHRFALTYTRKISRKRNTKFSLESIKGVGPSRRKALLEAFGSIRAIKEAKIPDLLKVAGMNEVTAESVYRHFHN